MIDQDKVVHPIAQYGTDIPPEYIIPPGGEPVPQEEYTEGVRPLDTLPAAWWNWLWNKITGGMRDAASMISSMYNELINLLTEGGISSPSTALDNQVASAVVNIHQRLATTLVPGSIKADSTTFGAIAVDGTTGVATMNGAGSGSFDTTAQSDITAAINELVSRVATLESAPAADSVPAGVMTAYAGETIPSGWLLCDGRAMNRTTYAALFTAIGTKWGAGDGSTTFNLPDMRDRVAAGASSTVALGTLQADATAVKGLSCKIPKQERYTYFGETNTILTGYGSRSWPSGGMNTGILFDSGFPAGTVPFRIGASNPTGDLTLSMSSSDSETRMKNGRVNYIIKF